MTHQRTLLSIPSDPRYLQLVRGVMEKITGIIGCSVDDSCNIILAVDEACSNIIKYSYNHDPAGKIDLIIEIRKNELIINIMDYGRQCDITQFKSRNIDDIKPGGLGIFIMNQVMDSLDFDVSQPDVNVVRMTKQITTGFVSK